MAQAELQNAPVRFPLIASLFLVAVFIFAQPYDFRAPSTLDADVLTITDHMDMREKENTGRRAGLLALAAVASLGLVSAKRKEIKANGALGYLVLFFLLWILLSITWSDDPITTCTKVIVLGLLAFSGLGMASRFSLHDLAMLVYLSCFITLTIGICVEVIQGSLHPLVDGYRFSGDMNPNFQGVNCALLIIAAVSLYRENKTTFIRYHFLSVTILAGLFLLLTKSRGSLAGVILGLIVFFAFVSSHRTRLVFFFTAMISACLSYFIIGERFIQSLQKIFLLDRADSDPSTLTGRLPFWINDLFPYIKNKFLLGYGYDSFWTPSHFLLVSPSSGWAFPDAHNTLIEIALGLGGVGAVVFLLIFVFAVKAALRFYRSGSNIGYAFAAAVVVCSFVNSLLSSIQFAPYLTSFIYIMTLANLAFVAPSINET